ncbi:DUF167 domain-containing protein [Sphingomonas sp. CCH5-D11]|uniref:DUF167 domain-containing protein n=1 Tax=Sphingomonas sp. CCH5-D11 TaxID=1768786 RepID=UPI0022B221FC|nr:DUF167 family protein [Sphingomonas sp. CCH5-D11]
MAVRLTPRGGRDALEPGPPEHFAARVSAPPVDGAANVALIALVAKTFGVSRGAVRITGGETARLKRLFVMGDPAALARIAASLYGQQA